MKKSIFLLIMITMAVNVFAASVRIKDIVTIQGLQDNQLMGIGLVTGLGGNGDSKSFRLTQTMIANLVANFGFDISEEDVLSKNVAAVMVTANIGPFTRRGENVDVTLSSLGDAKSLDGGILLQTALQGANKNVYAAAQGRILSGSQNGKGDVTASIPSGAIIERDVISNFISDDKISLVLRIPDFETANLIAAAVKGINDKLEVKCIDAGLVEIKLTDKEKDNPTDFITKLQTLTIEPTGQAIVVIDKKSGIIVSGSKVIIQQCAVSVPAAQASGYGGGYSNRQQKSAKNHTLEIKSSTVGELVQLLNSSGLTTQEIIGMIEAVAKAGAINGKIVIM
jgi:flagellar P-ring protein precursor FlgI